MNAGRAVALALVAVCGAVVALPAAGATAGAGGATLSVGQIANATDAPFGTHIAAFVTANVEATEGSVQRHMWQAAYRRTEDPTTRSELVAQRTGTIRTRLESIQAEKRHLVEQRKNGEISPLAFRSRMSGLAARLSNLRAAINDTADAGADPAVVRSLRRTARNASGPQMRAARGLGGGPPDGLPAGPGLPTGPPDEGPGGPPDGSPATPAAGTSADDCRSGLPPEAGTPPGGGGDADPDSNGQRSC